MVKNMGEWRRGRPKEFILSGKAKDILLSLYEKPKYLTELLRDVKGSPTTLALNLKELEYEGFIEEKYTPTARILNLTNKGIEAVKFIKMTEDIMKKIEILETLEIPKDRKKWILSLLNFAEKIKGTTRLMKYLFLIKKEYEIENEYNFIPYLYGPFSYEVLKDIEELEKIGLVKIDKEISEPKYSGDWQIIKIYSLTEKGKEITEKILNEIDIITKQKIKEAVETFNKYTLAGLLYYIYNKYPEYRECKEK
jgi:DNA-binding MarR family transcriptional regulator